MYQIRMGSSLARVQERPQIGEIVFFTDGKNRAVTAIRNNRVFFGQEEGVIEKI